MIDQNSSWTTTIPSSVPSGSYLIRFETIALHSLPAVSILLSNIGVVSYVDISTSNSIPNVLKSRSLAEGTGLLLLTNLSHSLELTVTAVSISCLYLDERFLTRLLSDPGLSVNLYTNEAQTESTYVIPGPPLYGSGSGSPAPAPAPVGILLYPEVMCLTRHFCRPTL